MFWTESPWTYPLGIILALTTIIISYYKWKFTYWKNKGIPFLDPSIPFGNLKNPLRTTETIGVTVKRLYDEFKKKKLSHGGVYFMGRPVYMLLDLDYIKNVLTKDFQHFVERGFYYNEKDDPLSAHLFTLGGEKWRNLRVKLSPTFTSGKMKMMFQTLVECEKNLQEKFAFLYQNKQPIDIKELLGCYTTDIIGSCAFGLEFDTFKDDNSPFRTYGKKVFNRDIFRNLKNLFSSSFPEIARFLKIRLVPKDISDFFSQVVKNNVEHRERNNYSRKDFMQMLIEMKNNKLAVEEEYKHDGKSLTLDELTAQCFSFFVAGFETSSTTMTFALYELAKNQDIQQKVRDEINVVLSKYDGNVTYDAIQEMKYMNQVLDETLRKYPPLPFITRDCVKDYRIPGKDIIIDKGTQVVVPILGIHYNEEYYPDPDKFDPERFNGENSKTRHQYTHIPFGEGPRICIGMRFGIMQSKMGLTALLRKYKFTLNKKTKQPMKFSAKSIILAADGEVWLDAEKI